MKTEDKRRDGWEIEQQAIQDRIQSELNASIMAIRDDDDFGDNDGDETGYLDVVRRD